MKHALISPNEPRESGYRVAEVEAQPFEVAAPLFWAACADDVQADVYFYDPVTQQFVLIPVPEPAENQPTTQGAQTL
jgi:hypothetical protein